MHEPEPLAHCAHQEWQPLFLAVMPSVEKCVLFAFRRLPAERKEDAVQEAIANAALACARLVRQGRTDRVFPTALANFAVRQTSEGRKVGGRLNGCDVLSLYCRKKKRLFVERLDRFDVADQQWLDSVVEDIHTPIPDQVCFRLDFPAWLATFPTRRQQIAIALALGHTTNDVASRFGISAGRVSQLRRQFHRSWARFHNELEAPNGAIQ